MKGRYDIRPSHLHGGWDVVDTRNGYAPVSNHPTREQALAEARKKGK